MTLQRLHQPGPGSRRPRVPRLSGILPLIGLVSGGCGEGPGDPTLAVASIVVLPAHDTVSVGNQVTFTATPYAADGSPLVGRTVTWGTTNPAVAGVSAGVVTGLAAGSAGIEATSEGKTGSAQVVVEPAPATLVVSLSVASVTMPPGATAQLRAEVTTTGGGLVSVPVQWTSTNPAAATVDGGGLVRAVGPGATTIAVDANGARDSAAVTVATVRYSRVAAAGHTCGVTTTGLGFCWGSGTKGELGHGRNDTTPVPVPVLSGTKWALLAPGGQQTCGLDSAGAAYCWGNNQLLGGGGTDTTTRFVPRLVTGGLTFRGLSSNDFATCGVTLGNAGYCWGENFNGHLGTTDGSDWLTQPRPIQGAMALQSLALSGGSSLVCGLTTAGAAWCWGTYGNEQGQLGTGTWETNGPHYVPEQVSGGLTFVTLSVGAAHVCGLTAAGAAYCWGDNTTWQLGDNSPTTCLFGLGCATAPHPVSGGRTFRAVAAGVSYSCGIETNGDLLCWGDFPPWSGIPDSTLVPVAVGMDFVRLSGATTHVCGVTSANVAYCWGDEWDGRLGTGTFGSRSVPTRVAGQP